MFWVETSLKSIPGTSISKCRIMFAFCDPSDVFDRNLLGVHPHDDKAKIKRAYMDLALKLHPDKLADTHDSSRFVDVHQAYHRILQRLDNGHDNQHHLDLATVIPLVELLLVRMMAFFLLFLQRQSEVGEDDWEASSVRHCTCAKPPTLVIDIDVSLDDVYHARVKKLVVRVNRKGLDSICRKIMIPLMTYVPTYYFPGMGDESDVNGDVSVNVQVKGHVSGVQIDKLINFFDLHLTVRTNLRDLVFGRMITLRDIPGGDYDVWYGGRDIAPSFKIVGNRGLPYMKDGVVCRGDLYVFFDMCMPVRPAQEMMDVHQQQIKEVVDWMVGDELEF